MMSRTSVIPARKPGYLVCLTALAAVLLGCVLPQTVSASGVSQAGITAASAHALGYSLTPSTTEPYLACPPPHPGAAACASIVVPPHALVQNSPLTQGLAAGSPGFEGGGEEKGWAPKELREAYNIPETGGSGQTVAIVDAFDDPHANSDLKIYREKYKLSPCTEENGCFKRVNQLGQAGPYPEARASWDVEISLDVDMVSALCPECHILLVEANSALLSDLYAAESTAAAAPGTTEISNSWYGEESSEETLSDTHFEHPTIPITAAGGDYGYDNCGGPEGLLCYPAASRYVIAVGGTELKKAEKTAEKPRGWEERVWSGSGGGCGMYEAKRSWQTDWGCAKRTDNDVAAVASPTTPVSLYDEKWTLEGGTSVATPIIAAIEAHASKAVREEGAEAFYRHSLFDVTLGSTSGTCGGSYLCTGEEGYDGPTGWGTPDGPLELATGFHAITAEATHVSKAGVTLNGYIDPEGIEVGYRFEYGRTTSYGQSAPLPQGGVGASGVWKAVSQSISAEQDATYHYRLVATTGSTTVYGQDYTFVTDPWTVQPTQKPTETTEATYNSNLYGVSCSLPSACTGVGWYESSSKARVTLADRWSGSEWVPQATVNPTGGKEDRLQSVSCSSQAACMAVGYYTNAGTVTTLAESWNGSSWSIQPTPSLEGAKGSELFGVSCTSPTACTAVGRYYTKTVNLAPSYLTLAERWNGEKWSLQATPNPEGASVSSLKGIACTSSSTCVAVGGYTNSSKVKVTLAERWNGTEWSIQSTLNPTGAKESALQGVSCSSSTVCYAVGQYVSSASQFRALAERWTESGWSLQSLPAAVSPRESDVSTELSNLTAISCSSPVQCVAVGSLGRESENTTLAEIWNGTEWSVQGAPRPRSGVLYGVACPYSTACASVGSEFGYQFEGKTHTVTLAEAATLPVTGKPAVETGTATGVTETGATLNGVVNPEGAETKYDFEYGPTTSYGTKTAEVGVGSGTIDVEESKVISLTASTTSHFRIVATNSHGTTYGADQVFSTTGKPTVETTAATNVGETGATLNGIVNPRGAETKYSFEYGPTTSYGTKTTEASAGSGIANLEESSAVTGLSLEAGYHFRVVATNSHGTTDGPDRVFMTTAWLVQEPANPGAKGSQLHDASCASSTWCAAVGWSLNSANAEVVLAESWNGTAWSAQEPPVPTGAQASLLWGVSCTSSTACTAAGYFQNSAKKWLPLAESWNGTAWSTQEPPVPSGATEGELADVSCVASTTCMAVGHFRSAAPLAESWNGTAWTAQEPPIPVGASESYLNGVSCTSSTACTAVGRFKNSSGIWVPLAERWNGTAWSTQEPPIPTGAKETVLQAVSCSSSTACTAVGDFHNSLEVEVPFAEAWNGTAWSVRELSLPSGGAGGFLHGVSCTSSTACTGVGSFVESGQYLPLDELWNGTTWSAQELPSPNGATSSYVHGVSCTAGTECTAVGEFAGNALKTLAERHR